MIAIHAILDCLCLNSSTHYDVLEEETSPASSYSEKKTPQTTESLAQDILLAFYTANANNNNLVQRIQDIVHETGWYEDLGAAVLTGLENALKAETPMGQGMRDAYDKAEGAVEEVWKFAKDHPVFLAVVALGILVILAPWALEVLGFGELGPIAGMFKLCGWIFTLSSFIFV